jgi:ParB-like chromosome segregation protein Spo0J
MKIDAASRGSKFRLEWVQAKTLTPNPANWRTHSQKQLAALRDVINDPEIGWASPLLFNKTTGRLIDGHGRLKIVDPEDVVPVLVGNWSESAEKKLLVTVDGITEMAGTDQAKLLALLEEVDLSGDLQGLGDDLAAQLESATVAIETADEDQVELRPVKVQKPPKMTWVLIGIATVRFGSIAADIERIAAMQGTIVESTANDG